MSAASAIARAPALVIGPIALAALLAGERVAAADPLRLHLEAGAALPLGEPQAHEYGVGAQGDLAAELKLARMIGVQLELGGLFLSHRDRPVDPSLADHGAGYAFTGMVGLRVRPFAEVGGPWIDADTGYVLTGDRSRFGFDVHLGYDVHLGRSDWDLGPYAGYLQVVQPSGAVEPGDAHVVSLGVHVAWGAERPPPPMAAVEPPPPPPPLPPPPPPPAPPPDRDGDGVLDAYDACPDVPGVHTDDPKTDGCPAAEEQVRVVKDRIEYDDVILFDTNLAHVHHASWPVLRKLAAFIVGHPDIVELDITGHADERGAEEYNMRLSQERAEAVKALLVRFGVASDRITTVGYGKSHPRAEGHTETEWKQNRRVEFIITKVRNAQGGTTSLTPDGDRSGGGGSK